MDRVTQGVVLEPWALKMSVEDAAFRSTHNNLNNLSILVPRVVLTEVNKAGESPLDTPLFLLKVKSRKSTVHPKRRHSPRTPAHSFFRVPFCVKPVLPPLTPVLNS
ncbi:hypothetical protein U0070_003709 [Myodes glareolus]|uniref:Uncharacterized protein n=1 Tax=Myodes glareolus TaxID=447135 RepID=A0AAW0IGR3_MYOGA